MSVVKYDPGFNLPGLDRWLDWEPDEEPPSFVPHEEPELELVCKTCGAHLDDHDRAGFCIWTRAN